MSSHKSRTVTGSETRSIAESLNNELKDIFSQVWLSYQTVLYLLAGITSILTAQFWESSKPPALLCLALTVGFVFFLCRSKVYQLMRREHVNRNMERRFARTLFQSSISFLMQVLRYLSHWILSSLCVILFEILFSWIFPELKQAPGSVVEFLWASAKGSFPMILCGWVIGASHLIDLISTHNEPYRRIASDFYSAKWIVLCLVFFLLVTAGTLWMDVSSKAGTFQLLGVSIQGNPFQLALLDSLTLVILHFLVLVLGVAFLTFVRIRDKRLAERIASVVMPLPLLLGAGLLWAYVSHSQLYDPPPPLLEVLSLGYVVTILPVAVFTPVLAITTLRPLPFARRGSLLKNCFFPLYLNMIRGHLLLMSIFKTASPFFLLSMPFGITVSLYPVFTRLGFLTDTKVSHWVLLNIFFAANLAWIAPLLLSLLHLEETCSKAYANRMIRTIQQLGNHIVILGTGDVGRGFLTAMVDREKVALKTAFDHFFYARNILQPNGRLAKLNLKLLLIDKRKELFRHITPFSGDCLLGSFEIAPCPMSKKGDWHKRNLDILIPAIIGDAGQREVRFLARLEKSRFVASLIRDFEQPFAVLRHLQALSRHREAGGAHVPPTLLRINSSTHLPYFSFQAALDALPVHLIHPEMLKGVNLGNALSQLIEADIATGNPKIKNVIITGQWQQAQYFLDALMKDLRCEDAYTVVKDVNFFLVSSKDQQELCLRSVEFMADGTILKPVGDVLRNPESMGTLARVKAEFGNLRVALWSQLTIRSFTCHKEKASNGHNGARSEISGMDRHPIRYPVYIIPMEMTAFESASRILDAVCPDVFVISDFLAEEELRTLDSVFSGLNNWWRHRTSQKTFFPLLFISAETGSKNMARNLADGMIYYTALRKYFFNEEKSFYPADSSPIYSSLEERFGMNNAIDVLEDVVERCVGVYEAHVDDAGERRPNAFEMNFCVPDQHGCLAQTIADLTGLQFGEMQPSELLPVFSNCRMVKSSSSQETPVSESSGEQSSDYFIFKSFAHLREYKADKPGNRKFSRLFSLDTSKEETCSVDYFLRNNKPHSVYGLAGLFLSCLLDCCYPEMKEESMKGKIHQLLKRIIKRLKGAELDPETQEKSMFSKEKVFELFNEKEFSNLISLLDKNQPQEIRNLLDDLKKLNKRGPDCDIRSIEDPFRTALKHWTTKMIDQIKNRCCGMTVCPVEAFHKFAESHKFPLGNIPLDSQEGRKRYGTLLKHYTFNFTEMEETASQTNIPPEPAAHMDVLCEGSAKPGGGALALNYLLLRQREFTEETTKGLAEDDRVANLHYIGDYQCHDQNFSTFTVYGNWESAPMNRFLPNPIRYVLIRPTSECHMNAWEEYGKQLCIFFNKLKESDTEWQSKRRSSYFEIFRERKPDPDPDLSKYRELTYSPALTDGS